MTKLISVLLAATMVISGGGEASLSLFEAAAEQTGEIAALLTNDATIDRDADFDSQLSQLLARYDGDYYAKIIVDTKENTVTTDDCDPVNLADYGLNYADVSSVEPVIPTVPVLEAAGYEASLEEDGTVSIEGEEDYSVLPEDAEVIGEVENGTVTAEIDGQYGEVPVGYLNEEQAQDFHFETRYNPHTEQIIITNPYQAKRLIVRTQNGRKLKSKHGAQECITDGEGCYILQFDSEDKTAAAKEKLEADSAVADVCCDEVVSATAALKDRGGAALMQSDRYKKYLADHGKNTKITVAVVDTGVETTHSFLKSRMVTGYNVYTKKACKTDDYGHGTHVAGIVADNTPSSVKIMPIKVLDSSGSGTELAVSLGIDWAVKHKANVINMSLGGYCTNDNCPIAQSIKKAYKAGVTVVVAAGNETYDTKYCCPARYSQCITVASATINGGVSTFSNYGAAVDLTAPGDMIYSSFIGNSYETLSGTSMASPFAAAGAAMFLTNNAKMTPAEVKSKLKSCCADMCLAGWDKYSGSGLINMGILLGDSHKADTFGLSQPENLTLNYFKHSTYYMSQLEVFCSEDEHLEDATGNHNYKIASLSDRTVKTKSSNPDVAVFDGRYIVPKKAGKATVTIWIDGGKSIDIPLTVKQTKVWIDYAASKFAGGKGTKKEPYLISTPQQLAKLALDVRNGKKYKGKYFKLTKDIDLKGKMWHSIAFVRYDILSLSGFIVSESFEGIFDGGNHKIKNMYVFDDPIQRSWGDNNAVNQAWYVGLSGLFGDMENCTVKNVGLENAYTSYSEAGLLADMIYQNTTVQNCYTTGRSAGYGLANGVWNANIRIKNCYSSATVLGGGMFGSLYSSSSDGGVVVSNCFFCGEQMGSDDVSDNGAFVAGAIESQKKKQATKLYNCFAATHALSNVGFAKKNVYSRLYKCYYVKSNKYGIKSNNNKKYTGLKANSTAFFKKKATYTNAKNWNKNYQWDFKNTWAIDKNINGGYPYLKKNKPLKNNAVNTNTGTWMDYAAAGFAGGTGTKSNPYLISNGAQLARISLLFRHGGAKGVYFKLTNDISLKAHPWFTIAGGEYMDSIYGSKYRRKRFYGNIDGAGHTISDMTVNGGDCVGFISDLSFGTVKNIKFKNVNISGGADVGTVCGTQNYRSLISNCTVDGTVSAKYRGGGITGTQSNCCVIANCKISADVTSETNGGGAAGYSGGEINATVFDGTVSTPNETDAGGIVAESERNNIIRNCCSFGCELTRMTGAEIISSYYTADGKGTLIRYQMGRNSDSIITDEEALLNVETFSGWDAAHDWNITDGAYPKPRWYTYQTPITALPSESWASSRAKSFAGGKGTKTSPYIIATAAQLAHVQDVISDEKMTYFRQVRDIDLGGKLWNSVYSDGGYYVYQMCYDGGGHTIKNLTMKNGQGLFPIAVQNSTIANIKLADVYGYAQSGLLADCFTGSRVVNCSVTGTLYPPYGWNNASEQMSGAVVGINYGIVENCSFSGTLYHCAGIVGDNEGTVRNCHSSGAALHGSEGIVAYNTFGTVENAYTIMKGSSRIEGAQGVLNCFSAADMCRYDYSDYEFESSLIKLSADLKNQATFKDWDFDKVWTISEDANSGLPYLRMPQEYKINYVTNGGTLPKYADDRYMTGFAHGLSTATKAGYALEGWYRDKALTQMVTMIGAKDTGNVSVYAKWVPAYSVKFLSNGGKGSMPNQLIARNTAVKLSANSFKKTGYLFTGWATSKNGKVVYKNKQSVKNLAGKGKTKTLYAQWEPITYQVEFCWPKSADHTVYGMDRQRFTYNQSKKLRKCTIPGPKGKKFKGWALTRNGPVKYKDGQKVKNLTTQNKKVVVLYAKYG